MTTREEKDAAAKAKLDAYVARVVAEAPPLTPEQRDQITRLFRGARVNVEKGKS